MFPSESSTVVTLGLEAKDERTKLQKRFGLFKQSYATLCSKDLRERAIAANNLLSASLRRWSAIRELESRRLLKILLRLRYAHFTSPVRGTPKARVAGEYVGMEISAACKIMDLNLLHVLPTD